MAALLPPRGAAGTGGAVHQPWFAGAPLTRVFAAGTALCYVMFERSHLHDDLSLDYDRLAADSELHRLFTANLTFGTVAELVMGMLVMVPLMRRYERELGTAKFGTMVAFVNVVGTFLELIAASSFPGLAADVRYSGPYPTLGAVLFLFHSYAPRLHPKFFSFVGFDFSEKSLTYIVALQVLLSGGMGTLQPVLCGAIAGAMYMSSVLPFGKIMLPEGLFGWLDSDVPQTLTARRGRGAARGGGAGGAGGGPRQRMAPNFGGAAAAMAAAQQPPPPPPPSEEAIAQLTAMGFERQAVIRALGQTDNNVEAAANRLLSGA
jgi:membrane associated rhomboid family serine protease